MERGARTRSGRVSGFAAAGRCKLTSSTLSRTEQRKSTASRPSMSLWSYVSARYMTGLISTLPATATGRIFVACMPRMALCGGLMMAARRTRDAGGGTSRG